MQLPDGMEVHNIFHDLGAHGNCGAPYVSGAVKERYKGTKIFQVGRISNSPYLIGSLPAPVTPGNQPLVCTNGPKLPDPCHGCGLKPALHSWSGFKDYLVNLGGSI